MRITRVIDATVDQVASARETAISLIGETPNKDTMDLFFCDNLEEVESGIKNLNEFSNRSWILSSILLYTLIYNNDLYLQSGLDWAEYSRQSRERLGIDQRDITEQLSAARFFIQYHKALDRAGFVPNSANRKLARAELALSLCGSIDETIKHLVNDTWAEYKDWYSQFKRKNLPKPTEYIRTDIKIEKNHYLMGDIEAITVSDKLPEEEQVRLNNYMKIIFDTIAKGYEPAIIPVYDKKEASLLERLRDKHRQGK